MFAYRTPGTPPKGFVLDAPEYRIEAHYPTGEVIAFRAIKPGDIGLRSVELGPLRGIKMSFAEREAMDRDFDELYGALLRAFAQGTADPLSQVQCHRFKEIFSIVVDPRLWPAVQHESERFMLLVQRCLERG